MCDHSGIYYQIDGAGEPEPAFKTSPCILELAAKFTEVFL